MTRFSISAMRCSRVFKSRVRLTASATSSKYRSTDAGAAGCLMGDDIGLGLLSFIITVESSVNGPGKRILSLYSSLAAAHKPGSATTQHGNTATRLLMYPLGRAWELRYHVAVRDFFRSKAREIA